MRGDSCGHEQIDDRTRAPASPRLVCGRACRRAGQGHGQSEAAAAACQTGRSEKSRQGAVRPQACRHQGHGGARDRLLYARLPGGRCRATDQWQDLAGDAAIAPTQLGAPRAHLLHGAPRRQGAEGVELARPSGRRPGAGARRPDAHRPHESPGRPRCRHLAHADAEDAALARRARGDVRDQRGGGATRRTSIRRSGRAAISR